MKKTLLAILLGLCGAIPLCAQSTTVSVTVVDQTAQAWANGTISYTFSPTPGIPGPFYWGGAIVPVQYMTPITVALDGSGSASFSVPTNTAITPSGSGWLYNVCPNASAKCVQLIIPAAGSTQNISAAVTAVLKALQVNAANLPKAYSDSEVVTVPAQGGTYYNVLGQAIRYFNGSVWANLAGSGVITAVTGTAPVDCTTSGSSVNCSAPTALTTSSTVFNSVTYPSSYSQYALLTAPTATSVGSLLPSSWTTGHTFVPVYQPSGSAIAPTIVDANTLNVATAVSAVSVECAGYACPNHNQYAAPFTPYVEWQLASNISATQTTIPTIATIGGAAVPGCATLEQSEIFCYTSLSTTTFPNDTFAGVVRGVNSTAESETVGNGIIQGIVTDYSSCATCSINWAVTNINGSTYYGATDIGHGATPLNVQGNIYLSGSLYGIGNINYLTGGINATPIGNVTPAAGAFTSVTIPSCASGTYAKADGSGCGTPSGSYTLPTATSSVLGGVKPDGTSILNTAGAISATAASVGADAAGAAATAQTNAETYASNASNLSSGTVSAGRIPTLNQNTTGTSANITATSNSTLTTLPSLSLPYSQVSGTPTLPATMTAVSHRWLNSYTSTTGLFTQTQPTLADIAAGSAVAGTFNFNISTLYLPSSAGNYTTANGGIAYDTTNNNWHIYANSNDNLLATFTAATPPTSGHLAKFQQAGNAWNLIDGGVLPTVGTWGALNYPTWTSGTPFVKMTAAGTFALDTNTYLTSSAIASTTNLLSGDGSGNAVSSGIAASNVPLLNAANTFTATNTFNNATYSALFTGGNVGIGTTAPGEKLHVVGNVSVSGGSQSSPRVIGDLTLSNSGITLQAGDTAASVRGWVTVRGNWNGASNTGGYTDFGTANVERMRITESGNVSIGDATATSMFNVGTANQFQVTSTGVSSAGAGSTDLNGSGVPEAHCLADGTGGGVCGTSTPAFSAITSATNTTAAMVVGSGASLGASGTGTINATALNGATFASPGPIGFTTPNTSLFTSVTSGTLNMSSQCVSIASPAACASASQGFFIIAAGSTSVTVNTTHTTGVGTIAVYPDTSIGSALGVTCNTTLASIVNPVITARTAGTSFTVSIPGTLAVNPGCYSYTLIN